MKHLTAIIIGLFLGLCSVHAQTSGTGNASGKLMTTFGEFSPSGSLWTVQVSITNRMFEISRHFSSMHQTNCTVSGTTTISCDGWKAKTGWFVFVENEERVWAYDGDKYLFLQDMVGSKGISYGPHTFPCPVPQDVLMRLTPKARLAIRSDGVK